MKQIEALFRNPLGYELSLPDYESSSIKFLLPINSVELLESTLELNDFDKKYLHNISSNGHLDKVELDYGKNQVFGILVEAGNFSLHIGNTKTPSYTPITEEVEKSIISSLREFMLEKTGKDITKEKWNSKENGNNQNVQVKFKVKLLPEGNDYVERWSEDNDSVEKGLFVFKEKNSFIAIDNRDGNCWTEDFDSLYHALVYASEAPFDLEEIKKMTMGDAKENAEKLHDEEEMAVMEKAFIHRYYLTERPVDIGTQPKGFINSKNFGYKTHDRTAGFNAWGYVEYDRELTEKEIKDYELRKPREFNPVPYEKKWKQDPSIINRMLAKDRSSEPTNSIWDEVQSCKTLAPGVYDVSTAGHGGIMVHSSVAKEFLSREALNAAYREEEKERFQKILKKIGCRDEESTKRIFTMLHAGCHPPIKQKEINPNKENEMEK